MYPLVNRLARVFALLGGLALCGLIVLTCLSILGRSLNGILHSDMLQSWLPSLANGLLELGVGPINGDFELVEAGMAFVIFAFLPLCQLNGAHASVDIFTSKLPPRAARVLMALIEVIFAAIIVLIAWKLFEGMDSKRNSGQTSLLLQFPIWWSYAVSLAAALVAALVAVYVAWLRCLEAVTGQTVQSPEMGADH